MSKSICTLYYYLDEIRSYNIDDDKGIYRLIYVLSTLCYEKLLDINNWRLTPFLINDVDSTLETEESH